MRALILAPHQDDEILSAYAMINRLLHIKSQVYIAYLTNGDYQGREKAVIRYMESAAALDSLGVDRTCVFYLGYGDTGMKYNHSFLHQLYYMNDDQVLASKTAVHTYHPRAGQTLHQIFTGQEAPYTRRCFMCDLSYLLDFCRPNVVILPSPYDRHGDHKACFLFFEELLKRRKRPTLLTYLLHAESDELWPNRNGYIFHRPKCLSKVDWDSRIILHMSETERMQKLSCINLFSSQLSASPSGYLPAFAKREEWFLDASFSLPYR